jgi:hypothetical protein
VTTQIHEDTTAEAFLAGKPDGVVVSAAGLLRPGHRLAAIRTEEHGIWSLAVGGDGWLYAGTGNDGRILGIRGDQVTVVRETGAVLVAALATGPDGEVYAGTVPGGRIYRIERMASGRRVSLLADLPDPNVWSLAVDELGRVFAGTGPEGRVHRIAPDGTSEVVLETGDRDILAVRVDGRGGLLVGTGGKGLLLHLAPRRDGYDVRVLHDFDEQEVRAIARVGDTLYAALNQDLGGGQAKRAAALVKAAVAQAARAGRGEPVPAEEEVGKKPASAGAPKALLRGTLYRVNLEGGAEKVLSFADNGIAALGDDGTGGLLVAAGRGGRVYRYTPEEGAELLHALPSDQASALAIRQGVLRAVGCANAGVVHARLESEEEKKPAIYVSRVLDARFVSRWGAMSVEARVGGLVVETRAGNTREPDATWSDWLGLRAPRADLGERAEGALRIASPASRFLQYRLTWPRGDRGAVRRVVLAYLPRNQRPRLSPVVVNGLPDPKAKEQEKKSQPVKVGPVRNVTWQADAVDGDPLHFSLAYRAIGTEAWLDLPVNATTLKGTTYSWDTTSVPDGRYVLRVVASDAPGNAEGALETTVVSKPFLVDNRKPAVRLTLFESVKDGGELRGEVEDEHSRIRSLEVSVDGGEWAPLAPTDALLDEKVETFVVRLPAGFHTVAVRARDEAGNVGVAGRVLKGE